MNYNLQNLSDPLKTFARHYVLPLWQYIVGPRTPEDVPYETDLDFTEGLLWEFVEDYEPTYNDVFEVFRLFKRVRITALQVTIDKPAPVGLIPVMDSGTPYDLIDCSTTKTVYLTPFGGALDRTTDLEIHSLLIDDPDYLGFRIDSGVAYLQDLAIRVQLVVTDTFPYDARSNSAVDKAA